MNLYGPKQLIESIRTVRKNTISNRRRHSRKGLRLSSNAGEPIGRGDTRAHCSIATDRPCSP